MRNFNTRQLTVVEGSGGGLYPAGQKIKIEAFPDRLGRSFRRWVGNAVFDNSSSRTTFIQMPNSNATVKAEFETIPFSSYQAWVDHHGLSGLASQPDADPDQDGRPNLREYAFSGNPLISDRDPNMDPVIVDGYLQFTFPRIKAATDIQYVAEGRVDLFAGSWSEASVVPVKSSDRDYYRDETYRLAWPLNQNPSGFLMVRIEQKILSVDRPQNLGGAQLLPEAPDNAFGKFINKTNGPMTISFGSAGVQHAKIVVCNIKGQEVRTILDGHTQNGTNFVDWDGRNKDGEPVASDVYILILKIGGKTSTKKVVINR